jgi:hypothetical protein
MAGRMLPTAGPLGWDLDDYSILRTVDSGKFGIVYCALHKPTGEERALKLIPLEGADSDEKVSAERHGAMLQQQFSRVHKHLVPEVFEHRPIAMFYAIAMELVHGQPLSAVIGAGPLPPRRAATIAAAICRFLEAAHSFETEVEGVPYKLIVHGDLKPDHVLLLDNDDIRVLDFGIAKALAERTLVTTNKWGSIQYASPERLQSEGHVNEQADFWSLGVMLFEMVAGYRPYRRYEHNASRLDAAIRRQETPEPLPADADPVLVAIIRKLLAPQIERRYTSATMIGRDFDAYLAGAPTVAATVAAQAGVATVRVASSPAIPPIPGLPPIPAIPPLPAAAAHAAGGRMDVPPGPIVATEPLPRAGAAPLAAPAAGGKTAVPRRKRSFAFRAVRFVVVFFIVATLARSCAESGRADRLAERIDGLQLGEVAAMRADFRRSGGTSAGLAPSLRTRLLDLADDVILEFRREAPSIAQVQWQQAHDSLVFAEELGARTDTTAAKRVYVEGHLARIAAGTNRNGLLQAINAFRESARLDPAAPDPYLGLARIYAYSLWDVDALVEALHQAEKRDYRQGRRERAQLGDAYRLRAERTRAAAARLSGEERRAQLQRAADDYGQCIAHFEDLQFFDSEANLQRCRRRLAAVDAELQAPRRFEVVIPFGGVRSSEGP